MRRNALNNNEPLRLGGEWENYERRFFAPEITGGLLFTGESPRHDEPAGEFFVGDGVERVQRSLHY